MIASSPKADGSSATSDTGHPAPESEVRAELEALLNCAALRDEPRLQRLLRHVVNETLAGRSQALKGYTIAIDVFGRTPDFNPSTDAVVRIHASRLRALLTEHYETAGRHSGLRIDIPKGSYVPRFERRLQDQSSSGLAVEPHTSEGPQTEASIPSRFWSGWRATPWGAVALLSLALLAFSATLSAVAPNSQKRTPSPINSIGLIPVRASGDDPRTLQTAAALSREFVRVVSASHHLLLKLADLPDRPSPTSLDLQKVAHSLNVRWLIWGTLAFDSAGQHRVVMSIADGSTGRVVRSNAYNEGLPPSSADDWAERILADLRPQFLALSRTAIETSQSDSHSPIEYFLLSTWTSGAGVNRLDWELERVAIARSALSSHPNYGPAHAVLADKLAYLANVDPPSDTQRNRDAARRHSEAALEESPDMAEAMFNLSAYSWHAGHLRDAVEFAERTLELSPQHILAQIHLLAVPFTCRPPPQAVIEGLENLDKAVTPSNPIRWVIQSWLARLHMNNGNYEAAVRAGRNGDRMFRTPDTSYQLAAALVATGQLEEARNMLRAQKVNWPNLDPNHYLKTTLPRRCREQGLSPTLARAYQALVDAAGPL